MDFKLTVSIGVYWSTIRNTYEMEHIVSLSIKQITFMLFVNNLNYPIFRDQIDNKVFNIIIRLPLLKEQMKSCYFFIKIYNL